MRVFISAFIPRFPHKSAAFSAYGAAISHADGDTRARGQTIVSTTRVRFAAVYVDSTRAHATRVLAAHAREIRGGHEWHERCVWRTGGVRRQGQALGRLLSPRHEFGAGP